MAEESIFRPFYTVLVLAFVCSALVAGAAVGLRPLQEANRQLDRKKHILNAAGINAQNSTVEELFQNIETRVVELSSGRFVPESDIDPNSYNQRKAAATTEGGTKLAPENDPAKLRRVEKYSLVYLINDQQGQLDQVVLPVRGKGLWSTMYAYVAIKADMTTISGVSFYEHGETPGLGGEIENEKWQAGWQGKKIYDPEGDMALDVVKGSAADTGPEAKYQIDGLSGATLTTKGVDKLLEFWFGDHGFQPFIEKMKNTGIANG